jgi:hypothetical protein
MSQEKHATRQMVKKTTCNNTSVIHATNQVHRMEDVMDGSYIGCVLEKDQFIKLFLEIFLEYSKHWSQLFKLSLGYSLSHYICNLIF